MDAVKEAARNECLVGLYPPRDRYFQGVGCRPQLSGDLLDVSLGRTASSIRSLATVFCRETWTSTYNQPQGLLERLQSQSQLPATSNHHSASHYLLRNLRAQSPSPHSALGEQRCRLQSLPFRFWSGCPPWPPSHMRSPNSWGPKSAVMASNLTLWSKTSEHHSTICKMQGTAWQYTAVRRSL